MKNGEARPSVPAATAMWARWVGATYPQQLSELRKALPHTFFLVPGYGAQGGGAEGIRGGYDSQGSGIIVNSSRAIMCAYRNKPRYGEKDFAEAAREEALADERKISFRVR